MVDFNNEITVGTPAADVVKILILQARANVFDSLEKYNRDKNRNIESDKATLKARLGTWFLEHEAFIRRQISNIKKKQEQKEALAEFNTRLHDFLISEEEIKDIDLIDHVCYLNKVCDDIRITRIDTRKQYDRTRWEKDNKEQGL